MTRSQNRSVGLCLSAIFVLALIAGPSVAQLQDLPRRSPAASVTQRVGITDITVHYHRPSVNDREVWGALVPYDAVWRAGANDNTTISFTHDVEVEGAPLSAGTYGLHMIPTEGDWTVIFSNNSTSWGSFTYDEAEDAARVTVTPTEGLAAPQLLYVFTGVDDQSAVLNLFWAGKRIPVSISVDTHSHVLARLENEDLRTLPRFFWWGWRDAANYALNNEVELEKALEWIDRSIGMEANFSNQMVKAGILDKLGRSDEAAEMRAAVLDSATEVQRNALGYQTMGAGDIDGAIEIFQMNVDRHPDSWNTYDSLAEAYANKGDNAKAVELYSKALEMTEDENQKIRIRATLDRLQN